MSEISRDAVEFTPIQYAAEDLKGVEISDHDLANLAACFSVPASDLAAPTGMSEISRAVDRIFARLGDEAWSQFKVPGSQGDE